MIVLNFLFILKLKTLFSDFVNNFINSKAHKIYLAQLIQLACPFCGSLSFKHNSHYLSNIHYITADASDPVIIRLKKQRVICNDYHENSMVESSLANKYCYISNTSKRKVLAVLTTGVLKVLIVRLNKLNVLLAVTVISNIY